MPPILAASLRGIPTVLHEQNGVMGRANRFLAPRVTAIATGFPKLKNLNPQWQSKTTFTATRCVHKCSQLRIALCRIERACASTRLWRQPGART